MRSAGNRVGRLVLAVLAALICGCVGTDSTVTTPDAEDGGDVGTEDAAPDSAGGPCEGVACSNHGTCFERSGDEPECVCDSGYRSEELECVEIDPNAPCEGVECSGFGSCSVEAGEPMCTCAAGYESGGALTCVPIDPCEGEMCSGHGTCTQSGGIARCDCDPQYEPGGLECTPEDADNDGDDFTVDCDDSDPDRHSGATEICDQVDNDCDGQVDEGEVCGIWVLEPRSSSWKAYPLDPTNSGDAPTGVVIGAFDIESLDRAYVITTDGYHVLRINTLAWEPLEPLSDIGSDLDTTQLPGSFAVSVPADHGDGDGSTEAVILSAMRGSDKIVWSLDFDIASRTFSPTPEAPYNEAHSWPDGPNKPEASEIRAGWLDIDNARGWMDADPSNFCDTTDTTVDPYAAVFTDTRFHMTELGYCSAFTHNLSLAQSPLMQASNPPPLSEVGAAFWHADTLYLMRGQ